MRIFAKEVPPTGVITGPRLKCLQIKPQPVCPDEEWIGEGGDSSPIIGRNKGAAKTVIPGCRGATNPCP